MGLYHRLGLGLCPTHLLPLSHLCHHAHSPKDTLTFHQGPCDPCSATLPSPFTRDNTSPSFAQFGVTCTPFTLGSHQFLATMSLPILSFGDSALDVEKDLNT